MHGRSKHIEAKFHFLREQVNQGSLEVIHCATGSQVADIMTKSLKVDRFLNLRNSLDSNFFTTVRSITLRFKLTSSRFLVPSSFRFNLLHNSFFQSKIQIQPRLFKIDKESYDDNLCLTKLYRCYAVEPPNTEQALKWLYKASKGGSKSNIREAVKWYMKAAEGGYVRAMYNISLCYSFGEGLSRNHQVARKWMKRVADRGHSKAQFEHGLALYSEGDMIKALVYLELASRAGEKGAPHVKNVIVHRLSAASRNHAMLLADSWRALPSNWAKICMISEQEIALLLPLIEALIVFSFVPGAIYSVNDSPSDGRFLYKTVAILAI
ncbi:uncharacterized protein LOC123905375 [Trifolium pratense]|uniref:uncharacterized protein LOC123905375 n=1 Tax=Trifolium pratense TaxID=57577 RepID=UPI001E696CC8|nr:uncharacterized protein LOC123905375 [Trifolium pratense]